MQRLMPGGESQYWEIGDKPQESYSPETDPRAQKTRCTYTEAVLGNITKQVTREGYFLLEQGQPLSLTAVGKRIKDAHSNREKAFGMLFIRTQSGSDYQLTYINSSDTWEFIQPKDKKAKPIHLLNGEGVQLAIGESFSSPARIDGKHEIETSPISRIVFCESSLNNSGIKPNDTSWSDRNIIIKAEF